MPPAVSGQCGRSLADKIAKSQRVNQLVTPVHPVYVKDGSLTPPLDWPDTIVGDLRSGGRCE